MSKSVLSKLDGQSDGLPITCISNHQYLRISMTSFVMSNTLLITELLYKLSSVGKPGRSFQQNDIPTMLCAFKYHIAVWLHSVKGCVAGVMVGCSGVTRVFFCGRSAHPGQLFLGEIPGYATASWVIGWSHALFTSMTSNYLHRNTNFCSHMIDVHSMPHNIQI